ncbi:endonuclease Q family protein [Alkalibacillus haloalkaliphilus]|uniref:endonuclease Q family protein n=1 Tax=Alkalibacillus haloalkaliphilus TaxID=94136 RepID=UPI0002EA7F0F|nr:endonuclease Q family protein [Alkalibacillus haloalkaliphilus]
MSKTYYADLHVHIGQTKQGNAVKISASNNLTVRNIFDFAKSVKGIDLIGIIDAHSPEVLTEFDQMVKTKEIIELNGGGLSNGEVTVLLGSEIEIYDSYCSGPIHVLIYFPTIEKMKQFTRWYQKYVKNPHLSSQRIYIDGMSFQHKVKQLGGLFVPAHVFTPFKSLYGKGVQSSLREVFDPNLIDAIELGLSSDTGMAEVISELQHYPFLTNSDAHSLENIGREYQKMLLSERSFRGLEQALALKHGKVICNYGLNPKLGKYYETKCRQCGGISQSLNQCHQCGSNKVIKGVSRRIKEIEQSQGQSPSLVERPPYIHQVPLKYVPGLGPKMLSKLRKHLHHDMYIIHEAAKEDLNQFVSSNVARQIIQLRKGELQVVPGGAGQYGKVEK